jgi:stage II sporulation protein D
VIIAIGRGFGHGVGMSQWGAYALAQQGKGFEQILQHYYRGAEVQPFRAGAGPLASAPGSGRGS